MSKTSQLAGRFLQLLGRFGRSNRGNFAMMFAIAVIPMLASTGMVIDYSRAAKARQQLQDALDSTALFLSKNSSVSTMTSAQLLAAAQTYFNVNFTNTDVSGTTISPSYSSTGPSVTVSGTTTSPCAFMGIVGVKSIPVSGTSTAVWGHQRLRVALVLDNTGSMSSSGKLTALKTATTNLLTQLQSAASVNGDVYVSIIPFVKDVNVGSSNYNASWVAFDDSSCNGGDKSSSVCDGWWDGSNGSCSMSGSGRNAASNSPRSYCLSNYGTCSISTYNNNKSSCLTAGTCSISSYSTQSTCTGVSGCFVSGTYSSSYTTSSTCTAVGTCTVSSRTTQSSCVTASCSVSSLTTQATCTSGVCSISSRTTQATCVATGTCNITSITSSSTCTSTNGCFISSVYNSSYTSSSTCTSHSGTWKKGTWTTQTAGTWTAGGTWTAAGTWTQTGYWNAGTWTAATWTAAVWTPSAHSTWTGCVTDRGASPFSASTGTDTGPTTTAGNDQLTTTPTTSDISTLFPAEQFSSCSTLQTMMGLNYNWSTMSTMVNNMSAGGSTNQPIGLVWGWQSLVGGAGLTQPAFDSAYQYKQVIILLSDGLNTQDRWYGDGSNTSTSVDNRMYYSSGSTISGTCKNIKDTGVIMYTVQVNTGGDPTSTLLQNCATDSSKFFLLTSSSAIITTFQSIGTALSDLRLSS